MKLNIFTPFAALGMVAALACAGMMNRPAPAADATATEANITRLTAGLLENSQFSHHKLDDQLAGKFFDSYLDALDAGHNLFTQSDLDGFAAYRHAFAQITRRSGDSGAERAIFDHYLERLDQRVVYLTNLLQNEKFDFSTNEIYSYDRKNAPHPQDLVAAQQLWRRELRAQYLQEKLDDKKPEEIARTLTQRYTQSLRNMKELSRDEVLSIYLNAMAHVYDPHSDYFNHEQMDDFAISMNLSLFGIGATLQNDDGYCTIHELIPGGPAARSNRLKPGDRIIAVAQGGKQPVDIMNLPVSRAVELIRGPKGSIVNLTVIPANSGSGAPRKTISLARDQIKLQDQQAKARIVDLPLAEGKIFRVGIIDLPSFYSDLSRKDGSGHRSASADVARLLSKFKSENVRGVILDLRLNGGGSLDEAINLAGLFIPHGPVVQTRGPDGDIDLGVSDNSKAAYRGPLVVLTSRYSASASEIVAGALQDYDRALIVGDSSTFGKGTVQNVLLLAPIMDRNEIGHAYDPGALKVTIRKFYRPSGASTQLRGVASDIVLPSPTDLSEVNESALDDPLPWDTVRAADYKSLNDVQPYLAELREDSTRRLAKKSEFAFVREDLARLKASVAKKSVSLNEADRRQEMAREKARQAEFDREILALDVQAPTTYDLNLENALLPGLPPPVVFTNASTSTTDGKIATGAHNLIPTAAGLTERDIILTETEQILADYSALLRKAEQVSNRNNSSPVENSKN